MSLPTMGQTLKSQSRLLSKYFLKASELYLPLNYENGTSSIINKSYCLLVFDIMVGQNLLHYCLSAIYCMASVSHEKYVCEVA